MGFNLAQALGLTGPVTVLSARIQVQVDPANLRADLILDEEKLGPASIPPFRFELDAGHIWAFCSKGISGVLAGVFGKPAAPPAPK